MTLNQIRAFGAVSKYLNITRAAESLSISEPSVFKQVKSLEDFCGVRLYRKVGRQIELTREGRLVQADVREYPAARRATWPKIQADGAGTDWRLARGRRLPRSFSSSYSFPFGAVQRKPSPHADHLSHQKQPRNRAVGTPISGRDRRNHQSFKFPVAAAIALSRREHRCYCFRQTSVSQEIRIKLG